MLQIFLLFLSIASAGIKISSNSVHKLEEELNQFEGAKSILDKIMDYFPLTPKYLPTPISDNTNFVLAKVSQLEMKYSNPKSTRVRNDLFINGLIPIKTVLGPGAQDLDNLATLQTMSRLANPIPENYIINYRASKLPVNNAWIDLLGAGTKSKLYLSFSEAFIAMNKLGRHDIMAIKSWTDNLRVTEELRNALKKLPTFEGIVVRNSMLYKDSISHLEDALKTGSHIPMAAFVRNEDTGPALVLASSAAGQMQFSPIHMYNSRLVIYQKTGHFAT